MLHSSMNRNLADARMREPTVHRIRCCGCLRIWFRERRISCCIWMLIFCLTGILTCYMDMILPDTNMLRRGITMENICSIRIILMPEYFCWIWRRSGEPDCLKRRAGFSESGSWPLPTRVPFTGAQRGNICLHRGLMTRSSCISIRWSDIFQRGCFICRIRIRTILSSGM